jgi:hypothetical protein
VAVLPVVVGVYPLVLARPVVKNHLQ